MPPILADELAALEHKLRKRGFHLNDSYLHECTTCHERAARQYAVAGRTGGRDIALCQACGASASWRSGAGLLDRELDPTFDLVAFLG